MALPSSGALSFQDIATELGVSPPLSLASMSQTAGFTAPYAVTDFYGYSGGGIITSGLILNLDASNPSSYSGTGDTWTDLSTSGNNATLVNSPTFSSGNGGYLSFNGSNQYGSVPFNTNAPTTSFTEMVWVYINSTSVGGGITSDIFMGGGNIPFQYFNSYGNNAASTGQWVFVVGTQSTAPLQQLYINASTDNIVSAATSQTFGWTGLPYFIGKRFDSTYANVRIGQVMVYDRALSASEVLQNYNATKERFGIVTSGLVLNLDASNPSSYSGSGTTWTDLSGNGNDMIMSGTVPFAGSGQTKYFSYDGTANFFEGVNNFTSISNAITVCAVVSITNLSQRSVFLSHSGLSGQPIGGYVFEAGGPWGNNLRWYAAGTGGQSNDYRGTAGILTQNQNYLLTITYNQSTGATAFYLNGSAYAASQLGSNAVAADWANSPVPNLTGSHGGGYAIYAYMNEYMLLVYNTALTAEQVTQNYTALQARFGL